MLRVLTLSTLFPDAARPTFGLFVERQTSGLAAREDVEVRVIAPIGVPPGPLARLGPYRRFADVPVRENWKGLRVDRPRFPVLPVAGARLAPALLARALLPLLRAIRAEFAFDVIDTEFFWPDGPAAVRLGKALGVPVSIKARGSDVHHWSKQAGCVAQILAAGRAADGMLAVSGALRADMIALGMPGERIRVHHTGVDLDRFRPVDRAAAKARLGVAGPLILTVGHLIERKGQRLVVEALADLPGTTLMLVGDGPAQAELAARITALGLGDRVRMPGNLAQDEVAALHAAADVMALPSASEGLANAWVEAIACGTPVVIADVGGARELVDRPAAGRLVPRDPAAIAEAIRDILADPPAQADVRAAAERFTWAANTEALYAHLAGLKR